jgi:hypothetical protein
MFKVIGNCDCSNFSIPRWERSLLGGGTAGDGGAELMLPALDGLSEYPGVPGGVAERSRGGAYLF